MGLDVAGIGVELWNLRNKRRGKGVVGESPAFFLGFPFEQRKMDDPGKTPRAVRLGLKPEDQIFAERSQAKRRCLRLVRRKEQIVPLFRLQLVLKAGELGGLHEFDDGRRRSRGLPFYPSQSL